MSTRAALAQTIRQAKVPAPPARCAAGARPMAESEATGIIWSWLVLGTGLTLPLDVESYGAKDSEYAVRRRTALAARAPRQPGVLRRPVVVEAEYARTGFLHAARDLRFATWWPG